VRRGTILSRSFVVSQPEVRFKAGTTDYLEVLTNETNSFSAELGLAQAQANELIALVQIYQALGGGWQE
jgi:multidrug efflux system outer membrane protein